MLRKIFADLHHYVNLKTTVNEFSHLFQTVFNKRIMNLAASEIYTEIIAT